MNLGQLSDADLRALREGNLSALSDAGLAMLRGAPAPEPERPPVDPATEGLDPRDVQARRRPAPAAGRYSMGALREVWDQSSLRSMVRGGKDLLDAGAQLAARGANKVGLVGDDEVGRIDRDVRQGNSDYLYSQNRSAEDFDPFRTAGNILSGAAVLPTRIFSAPAAARTGASFVPLGRRAGQLAARSADAAVVGAAAGTAQPVFQGDFADEKKTQIGIGAGAGAIGAPLVEGLVAVAGPAVNAVARLVRQAGAAIRPQQVDNLIAQALEQQDIPWASLGEDVREALRQDVRQALATGGMTDPVHVRRLADIRAVGATPTRGAVTLDPVAVTAERNVAKQGANSTDPVLQQLARTQDSNNTALIERMNDLGARNAPPEIAAGGRVLRALRNEDAARVADIDRLYTTARSMTGGRAAALDLPTFQRQFNAALDAEQLQNFVPENIRRTLNRLRGSGMPMDPAAEIPLTVDVAQQLDKLLSIAQRTAADGNERRAAGIIRNALMNAPIEGDIGDDAMRAYTRARDAARRRFQWHEQNPALAAAIDGEQPDRFVRQFILEGSNSAADLQQLRRAITADPESLDMIRQQIVAHLKSKALSGAEDEVGGFSSAGYRKALNAISEAKLRVFFSEQEIAQLRQVGRAASYMQVQKPGTAVNNSNTASAAMGALDRILSRVPYAGEIARGHINRVATNQARAGVARNALRALPSAGGEVIDAETQNALRRALPLPAGRALAGALATQQEE
jgi:hypothetical protein